MNKKFTPVIGLEIHVELRTQSKMFCGCPAEHFGMAPNTHTCPVCLGLPGALPVPNRRAIEWTILLGLALKGKIRKQSKFDRKHYFYPYLPKGYQISQYDIPFCKGGKLLGHKITRVHMEEDTGKLIHSGTQTLIDFNRSGVPLVEIVTEPDFSNLDDATAFLKETQAIVRTLGISTADMEKGSMRLEANISVKPFGSPTLPKYKVEIKNVNSFRFIKKAIEFEVSRQIRILDSGQTPPQETRGFSETKGETVSQRNKEEAHDYRYFPEPDIPPFEFTKKQVEKWRSELPILPAKKRDQLQNQYNLPLVSLATIVSEPIRLQLFESLVKANIPPSLAAGTAVNAPLDVLKSGPKTTEWINTKYLENRNVYDESEIRRIANKVILANPKAVSDIKSGKTQVIGFLIGQVKLELKDAEFFSVKKVILDLLQISFNKHNIDSS